MSSAVKRVPVPDELERLRAVLERLDADLIAVIARRVRAAHRIAAVKRSAGLPILDPSREAAVVRRAAVLAREAGLPEEDTCNVVWAVIGLTRRVEHDHDG